MVLVDGKWICIPKYEVYYKDIIQAIRQNNPESAIKLIDGIENLNYQNETHWTLLNYSISFMQEAVAIKLIDRGINFETRDLDGHSPLIHACFWHQTELVNHLIKSGADLDVKSNENKTAFSTCCLNGSEISAIKLMDAGCNTNFLTEYGYSAFTVACQYKMRNLAIKLLDQDKNFNLDNMETMANICALYHIRKNKLIVVLEHLRYFFRKPLLESINSNSILGKSFNRNGELNVVDIIADFIL